MFYGASFSPNEHYVNFTRPTTATHFVVHFSNIYSLRRNVEQKTTKHERGNSRSSRKKSKIYDDGIVVMQCASRSGYKP